MLNRRLGKSTPASCKAPHCHRHSSASTLLICRDRQSQSSDTNYRNIKYTQNEALRIATGCHKISSVDHLHVKAKMLRVREHSELLSQYLARCLESGNVCHSITTRETTKRRMKETLFIRHLNTVEPMMLANNRQATLQAIHSDAVNKAVKDQKNNIVVIRAE